MPAARVLVDPGTAAAWIFDRLAAAGGQDPRAADPCLLPKACKNPVELDGTRAAHRRDGAALTRFLAWLAREAPQGRARRDRRQRPARSVPPRGRAFPRSELRDDLAAPARTARSCTTARRPETEKRLEPGTLYLLDSGAQYLDGTTDVTRTVAIGEPSRGDARPLHPRAEGPYRARAPRVSRRAPPGTQLDAFARRALWQEGLDYDHGTGHGVGSYLGVHEGPQRISKAPNAEPLLPGHDRLERARLLQDRRLRHPHREPGGGAAERDGSRRREREMLGFETLTLAPIDRALVDRDLLDDDEIAWLDAYHARVRAEIGPLVDPETARWLEAAPSRRVIRDPQDGLSAAKPIATREAK